MTAVRDTIYALSSGRGRAAVAVIRLSGPHCASICASLTGSLPAPRRAVLRTLRDQTTGKDIDQALVLWLPGPGTFTGEDMLELQVHGSTAVIQALFRALRSFEGLRLAERGEYTRRAVENGRMTLVDAEGLADLINAETEAQRAQALRQAAGALDAVYEDWRKRLLGMLGHLEAHIDFVDEEDVPPEVSADVRDRARALAQEIASYMDDSRAGERLREGVTVVIAGPPNAGKSSLLNCLARRDVAIVSDTPGTTRDVIEVNLDLDGYPATLVDTAGLREAGADQVEDEGIRRARQRAAQADIVIWVRSPDTEATAAAIDSPTLRILNKADLGHTDQQQGEIAISARTGEGIPVLLERLTEKVRAILSSAAERPLVTRERHRLALQRCVLHLLDAAGQPIDELVAEDLRLASRQLGRVVGRIDIEEVLGEIFAEFCIGK